MAKVNSLPLNTSILRDKTSVFRFKDLTVLVQIPHPTPPGQGSNSSPPGTDDIQGSQLSTKRGQVTGCVKRVFNIQEIRRKRSLLSNR